MRAVRWRLHDAPPLANGPGSARRGTWNLTRRGAEACLWMRIRLDAPTFSAHAAADGSVRKPSHCLEPYRDATRDFDAPRLWRSG